MNKIYSKSLIENNLPIKKISDLALKEGNSKKPVYRIHKWWARRLGSVVRALLIGATLPHDASENDFWGKFYSSNTLPITVLDPFMGGGTTLVEAKKMGAKTIGVDIDPLACFITKKELESLDYDLAVELEHLARKVGHKIKNMYITQVENEEHQIINVFWVYEVLCPQCDTRIESHPHYKLFRGKKEQHVFCKHCGEVHVIDPTLDRFECTHCGKKTLIESGNYSRGYCICEKCGHKFELQKEILKNKKLVMFALEYEKEKVRFFKKADKNDIELFKIIEDYAEKYLDLYFLPTEKIPCENRTDNRPLTHGYFYYKDLFNSRQLISLAMLYDEIRKIENPLLKEWFVIAFSDALASNNILCNYAYGYRKLTPLFGIHAYTIPVRPVENNVWGSTTFGRGTFEKVVNKLIKAKEYCSEVYESKYFNNELKKVFTGEHINSKVTYNSLEFYYDDADTLLLNTSSENLEKVQENSVDLILTDPPYYDNLHYSELADFYYQWIKGEICSNNQNPLLDSLYVHNLSEESHTSYEKRLVKIFRECYCKLRDEGMMIFSYHHNKPQAWAAMGKAIKQANFVVTNTIPIRSEGNSGYHTTENSIKWDSIIILRKRSIVEELKQKDIGDLIKSWESYFLQESLELKKCDKLSFYRSLAVQVYSNKDNYEINSLIEAVENLM